MMKYPSFLFCVSLHTTLEIQKLKMSLENYCESLRFHSSKHKLIVTIIKGISRKELKKIILLLIRKVFVFGKPLYRLKLLSHIMDIFNLQYMTEMYNNISFHDISFFFCECKNLKSCVLRLFNTSEY